MPEKGLWDRLVNSKWPNDKNLVPTDDEAIRGTRRLYRKAMGKPWRGPVKITSGSRHTWIRRGVLYVNPAYRYRKGWPGIVHSISHWAHMKQHPSDRPHSARQAYIERDLVDYVLASGFLDGKLKPKDEIGSLHRAFFERGGWRHCRLVSIGPKWITLRRIDNAKRVKLPIEERRYLRPPV